MNVLVSTLALGSIYSLLALCFIVDFRTKGFLNFTILSFMSLAPFIVSVFGGENPSAVVFVSTFVFAVLGISLLAFVQDRLFFKPLSQLPSLAKAACGLSLFSVYILVLDIGWSSRPRFTTPFKDEAFELGSTSIAFSELFVFLMFVAVAVALYFYLFRTRSGKRFRSYASDNATAKSYGVSPEVSTLIASFVVGLLASIAGIFQNLDNQASQTSTSFIAVSIVALCILLIAKGVNVKVCLLSAFGLAAIQTLVSENLSSFNSAFQSLSSTMGIETKITLGTTFASVFIPVVVAIFLAIVIPKRFVKEGIDA